MSGKRAFAALISAEIRLLTMAMHGVGLTLMPEEASSGRKPGVLATLNLAAVGLQVGINELVVVALQLLGLVVAARFSLPWAVEQAILSGICVLVEIMVPCRLTIAAQTARVEGRWKSKSIISNGWDAISVKVLGSNILGSIQLAAHPW